MVPRELLVNAHVGAYGGSIPLGSCVHSDIVPAAGETDPDPGGNGAAPDDGMLGCPDGTLPATKLILCRSSLRDSTLVAG
jgi:hypothetical protein